MDFKLTIKCQDCRCSFELRPYKFKARDSMRCPNCDSQIPDDVFQNIKTGIESMGEIPVAEPLDMYKPPFTVSIEKFSDVSDMFINSKS